MPGAPPKPDMDMTKPVDEAHLPDSTKDEMAAGREALVNAGQRTKDEMAAGRAAIAKYPQPSIKQLGDKGYDEDEDEKDV